MILIDRLMVIELLDEVVNKFWLEENDYVIVFVEEDKIVIKKVYNR